MRCTVASRERRGDRTPAACIYNWYDTEAQIRAVSLVFEKDRCFNRQTPQPRNLCNTNAGKATRARSSVFQEALTATTFFIQLEGVHAGLFQSADSEQKSVSVAGCGVSLATFMEVLDTAIASVALPYTAGSLSASTDETTWRSQAMWWPTRSSFRPAIGLLSSSAASGFL